MKPIFYQKFQNTVGQDVVQHCQNWFKNNEFPDQVNRTTIVFILKKACPKTVKDLRPISLCNVIYKIYFKTLANRRREILPSLIIEEQSVFILGQSLIDNILLAFETIRKMKSVSRQMIAEMAIKIDINKAYDRMWWEFLTATLTKLDFDRKWLQLMLKYVQSITYMVNLNGKKIRPIMPQRGLRQGDPLSLYILCAKGLSSYFNGHKPRVQFMGCAFTGVVLL